MACAGRAYTLRAATIACVNAQARSQYGPPPGDGDGPGVRGPTYGGCPYVQPLPGAAQASARARAPPSASKTAPISSAMQEKIGTSRAV